MPPIKTHTKYFWRRERLRCARSRDTERKIFYMYVLYVNGNGSELKIHVHIYINCIIIILLAIVYGYSTAMGTPYTCYVYYVVRGVYLLMNCMPSSLSPPFAESTHFVVVVVVIVFFVSTFVWFFRLYGRIRYFVLFIFHFTVIFFCFICWAHCVGIWFFCKFAFLIFD